MDEGFNLLVNGGSRVEQLPVQNTVTFNYSTIELESRDVLTAEIIKKMAENEVDKVKKPLHAKDIQFFKPDTTSKRSAQRLFTFMERWYINHVILKYYRKQVELRRHMEKLLITDPVGVTDPPTDDKICWDATTVLTAAQPTGGSGSPPQPTTRSRTAAASSVLAPIGGTPTQVVSTTEYKQTQFLIQLKHAQRDVYLHLRITLTNRFSNKDAKTLIENFITDEEEKRVANKTMAEENRFEVGVRVSWEDIKDFVLRKICIVKLGSHYFSNILTIKRKDDQTVIDWIRVMERLYLDILNLGNGWDTIIQKEITPATAIWVTETEGKVIWEYLRDNSPGNYKNYDDFVRTVAFSRYRDTCHKIEQKKWPKSFKQAKHKEAMKLTLVPYPRVQEMINTAKAELLNANAKLREKYDKALEKIKNLERKLSRQGKLGGATVNANTTQTQKT